MQKNLLVFPDGLSIGQEGNLREGYESPNSFPLGYFRIWVERLDLLKLSSQLYGLSRVRREDVTSPAVVGRQKPCIDLVQGGPIAATDGYLVTRERP